MPHKTTALPFAHLNLRRNPFGEFTIDERTSVALVDVRQFVERLSDPNYVVQFTGEKGYGKTTHLLAIRSHFPAAGYVHINEGETAPVPSGSPVLIDEAQRLTFLQRLTLFRRKVPLVLGTHRDFTTQLKRAGRKVETIDAAGRVNTQQLATLLNDRIAFARRSEGPIPTIGPELTAQLRNRFGNNIRRTLDELYDVFQSLDEIREL